MDSNDDEANRHATLGPEGTGDVAASTAVAGAATASDDSGWTTAESPTGGTLYDVEQTANGVYTAARAAWS